MSNSDFDKYFLEHFNTTLIPSNEERFQRWLKEESKKRGKDLSKDLADYDLRGYWLNIASKGKSTEGHMTDVYKKPNHPTFSDQSQYHGAESPWGVPFEGGTWANDGKTFTPTATMLRYTHPLNWLRGYMQKYEPNVQLNMDRR